MGTNRGKILDIDLSSGTIKTTKIKDDVMRKFIGGAGLAAKLFLDRVPPDTDPLSAKNVLFLVGGPLSGTNFFTSSRLLAALVLAAGRMAFSVENFLPNPTRPSIHQIK